MAGNRSSSIDSGRISSDVFSKEETKLKPVFRPSIDTSDTARDQPSEIPRSNTMPSQYKPRVTDNATNRRSFHETPKCNPNHPKADSDSDAGIVPDVTKILLGNKHHRKSGKGSPTYSIHINTLYVYQNPTMPVENPMYQQLPVDKRDEQPPSPCSKPGYQYVWPTQKEDDIRQAEQHSDIPGIRPTSLNLQSNVSGDTSAQSETIHYRSHSSNRYQGHGKPQKDRSMQFSISSPQLEEGEEMEILIKGKSGKSRRYKLQPIQEYPSDADPYIMNTSSGDRVVLQGFTVNDQDEAFSEADSSMFQDSSPSSTAPSRTPSGNAINTTVGDCQLIVKQTFQSTASDDNTTDLDTDKYTEKQASLSENDLSLMTTLPSKHEHKFHSESSPSIDKANFLKNPTRHRHDMNFPDEFDTEANKQSDHPVKEARLPNALSKSVPNIALSTKFDTCYECRNQKRGIFSSRQKLSRSCTLEGFHHITDEHEVSFMKEILDKKGKLGNWFITPTTNQPGYNSCLYVKSKREVSSFPVALNKKRKFFIDFSMKKSFACLCKLTEFYKSNHLPSLQINLGQPLPNDAFPDMNFGADGADTLRQQYAGIKL